MSPEFSAAHLAELETAGWKDDRRFRVLTVDRGTLSFSDLYFNTPTKVLAVCILIHLLQLSLPRLTRHELRNIRSQMLHILRIHLRALQAVTWHRSTVQNLLVEPSVGCCR